MIQGLYRIHDTGVIQDTCYRGYTGYRIQVYHKDTGYKGNTRIQDTGVAQGYRIQG